MFLFRRQPITMPYFPQSSPMIGYQRKWNISAVEVDQQIYVDTFDFNTPNNYHFSGIGWVLGKFDRGWTERPIYGKIRYMATENTKKKYKTTTYIATYSNSGLKRKTLMKKQTQLPLSFKKENKTSSENSDSSGADSPKKLKRVRDGPLSETESNKVPKVESKVEA